jgi:hypothetical protein
MAFFLEKKKTKSTPYILIDEGKNYMKFEGDSFPEFTVEFYREASDWLRDYLESDFELFTFDCALKYINSSSTKILFDMLALMDESSAHGKRITINCYIESGDDMMTELYEDIGEELESIKINLHVT